MKQEGFLAHQGRNIEEEALAKALHGSRP